MRGMNERGSVSVMLALCMTVVIGAGALAIDAGQVWSKRRQLITAADAAAFAAAEVYAEYGNGCDDGTAAEYAALNAPGASSTCSRTGTGTRGTVTVSVSEDVEHQLAAFIGRSSTEVDASSTVYFGPASGMTGLRPFGLCQESNAFREWQESGHSLAATFTIPYTKDNESQCGGSIPGNWALIDFDGGNNSLDEFRSWIRNGYPGEVEVPVTLPGDPGSFSEPMDIASVVGEEIYIPVFDSANGQGQNSTFHLTGFVSVEILFRANGPESHRYLEVRFATAVASGKCCGNALDGGLFAVGLCKVDNQGVCP
jgi:hypothetical protein